MMIKSPVAPTLRVLGDDEVHGDVWGQAMKAKLHIYLEKDAWAELGRWEGAAS